MKSVRSHSLFWSIFSHIRTEYRKIGTTKNSNTFHTVKFANVILIKGKYSPNEIASENESKNIKPNNLIQNIWKKFIF